MYIRGISIPRAAQPRQVVPRSLSLGSNAGATAAAFPDLVQEASTTLSLLDRDAVQSQIDLVTGNARDMHTAVLAMEKASMALDLVISIRNKAIEAYQEIMRMPL